MRLDLRPVVDLKSFHTSTGRRYITPNGDEYPSVTTVLGRIPNPGLEAWKKQVGEDEARRIVSTSALAGTQLHEMCECYLLGEDVPEYGRGPKMLFRSIQKLLSNVSVVHGIEMPLWSDRLRVAGRVDLIGVYRGKRSIVDFKNSRKQKELSWIESYLLQETIYGMMYMERYQESIEQIVTLVACWDGTSQEFVKPLVNYVPKAVQTIRKYNYLFD